MNYNAGTYFKIGFHNSADLPHGQESAMNSKAPKIGNGISMRRFTLVVDNPNQNNEFIQEFSIDNKMPFVYYIANEVTYWYSGYLNNVIDQLEKYYIIIMSK